LALIKARDNQNEKVGSSGFRLVHDT